MKVLVIGSGGREHTLVWKCRQSPLVDRVYCAPGNGGIGRDAELIEISPHHSDALLGFAKKEKIDLTIVGPEQPLVSGIVDQFEAQGLKIWGPDSWCSQLEGSKAFAKAFMQERGIPTARFQSFSDLAPALAFLKTLKAPYVVKADGLAGGKGVVIAKDRDEAEHVVEDMLLGRSLGDASRKVVIEEFIHGEEVSFIVLAMGEDAIALATSQDHKTVRDGDQGPNTGGMGAYSPAPIVDAVLESRIMTEIIRPVLRGMAETGHPYCGFLYAGLMIDENRNPKVLEFNCRLGDPEAEPLLFRLESDLVSVILSALDGKLAQVALQWTAGYSACVVLAAKGYPGAYEKGKEISGIPEDRDWGKVFHAGTILKNGKFYTHGGRVLAVTAKGPSLPMALSRAYEMVQSIHWEGMHYRSDIGAKGLKKLQHA